ncbi:MAG TPA: TIM barrel protein [Polyangia bacterium]|jgi:Sugar phosphate isomerases/epimerases|nr:TIM barrel protein [Polyangia bacterium]
MAESPRIYIGNQTAFFAAPLQPFAFAVEQGFDAFEFFPDGSAEGPSWATADVPPELCAFIREQAERRDIRLSVHASLTADPMTVPGLRVLARDVAFARDIGAQVVNLHLAPVDPEVFGRAVLFLAAPLQAVGLQLSLENTIATAPEDINALFDRLRARDRARARSIGVCLDIGHANLYQGTRNDYLGYLDRLSAHVTIVHVHVHENRGEHDSHMTLFTGPAGENPLGVEGLVQRLVARGYTGSIIFEQWPRPSSLLVTARNRLRAIIEVAQSGKDNGAPAIPR